MLQFGARVVDAELPVDPGLFAIVFLGPTPGLSHLTYMPRVSNVRK